MKGFKIKQAGAFCLVIMFAAIFNCSHTVQFSPDEIVPNQKVILKTVTGAQISGYVSKIENETIVIVDKQNQPWRAAKSKIAQIEGPETVYDANGKIIGEREIQKIKTRKNFWLFALSGGALSLGTSFFISSMASRATEEGSKDPIIYGGTAAGTIVGTWLFSKAGSSKDYKKAVEQIRRSRPVNSANEFEAEKAKQHKVQAEIDKIQKEREEQEKEIDKLRSKILEKN